jgi:hypothetical protein
MAITSRLTWQSRGSRSFAAWALVRGSMLGIYHIAPRRPYQGKTGHYPMRQPGPPTGLGSSRPPRANTP